MSLLNLISRAFFLTGYFAKSAGYPSPLPAEIEQKYLLKAAQGDQAARDKLINHNLRLVAHVAKKYTASAELDELICVGNVGLVKGMNSYKLGHGTALATYLARCIENEILMMLRSNKRYRNTIYLQDTLGVDSEGNAYTLMEVLEQKEESVFRQVELSVLCDKIQVLMAKTLTEREHTILQLRYGLNGKPPQTQLQTAEKLNISRSYVSRIEAKALEKLRNTMNKDEY